MCVCCRLNLVIRNWVFSLKRVKSLCWYVDWRRRKGETGLWNSGPAAVQMKVTATDPELVQRGIILPGR